MKKLFILLMGLLLVLSSAAFFAGCDLFGSDDDDPEATPTPDSSATPTATATPAATPAPVTDYVVDLTAASDFTMDASASATYNSTDGRLEISWGTKQYDAWGRNLYNGTSGMDMSAYSSLEVDAEIVTDGTNFKVYISNGDWLPADVADAWATGATGRAVFTVDLTGKTISDVYQLGVQNNTASSVLYIYSITFKE